MLDRESLIEAVAAIASVLCMLGLLLFIGQSYGTGAALGEDGARALVAAITGFIIFVTIVGIALAYATSDPTPPDEDADAAA